MRIGLISDTHGLLRPEALAFLEGSEAIVHAGDVVSSNILEALRAIAPLTVVRGNNDVAAWADDIPEMAELNIAGIRLWAIHDLKELDAAGLPTDVRVVVAGHTHQPRIEERSGVLWVNPGSAGPRRFRLPISVGEIVVEGGRCQATIVRIDAPGGEIVSASSGPPPSSR